MFTSVTSIYNTNQTRILIFAVIFAVITNIATIFFLFEQLEHEALCDQQNDFNDFVEDPSLAIAKSMHQEIKSQHASIKTSNSKYTEIIIPKPNKLDSPPLKNDIKANKDPQFKEQLTSKKKKKKKSKPKQNTKDPKKENKESSILDARGLDYVIHDFPRAEMKAVDWKYYLDYTVPKISYDVDQCNHKHFVSHIFMDTLNKWIFQREYGWFIKYDCPSYLQTEYRPKDLIPHIYNTQCAPFYPSDIIYLLSQILSPSMLSIQYGFSLSSVWITNFVDMIHVVDNKKDHVNDLKKILEENKFDISNIDIQYQRMSKRYVQVLPIEQAEDNIDFIIMDRVPEYHDDVLKYIVNALKKNNGILLIKMFDHSIPDNFNELINDLIPKSWLRYDSYLPQFLVQSVPFSQEQYLDQYNVSLWITRTEQDPCQS